MSTSTNLPLFHGDQIAVVRLRDWLDWVTARNADVTVALPMIQRGSVWKPLQIAELWDSLLRGMPIGSLTVTREDDGRTETFRKIRESKAINEKVREGTLFLLDGQQRTLAMCIGWIGGTDRRVWVDFDRDGVDGRPFHLRVTTQHQPFGFDPNDHKKKLSRSTRDKARDAYHDKHGKSDLLTYELPLDITVPYGAKNALLLHRLIDSWRDAPAQDRERTWSQSTITLLNLGTEQDEAIKRRVRDFAKALAKLWEMHMALVRVSQSLIESDGTAEDDEVPALVTLFQRIANAGQPLSNADYVFSLIKHRLPEAHNYVASLHGEGTVASLLSANDLVMTAVRIAAACQTHSEGKAFPDYVSPSPKEFSRILRLNMDGASNFLEGAVKPLIDSEGRCSLGATFKALQTLIEYRAETANDRGVPRLAFPRLGRPLVQVLLFWLHQRQLALAEGDSLADSVSASRDEMLRFVLFWLLGIGDTNKASSFCIKLLRTQIRRVFPGRELYQLLYDEDIAYGLQPLEIIRTISKSPDNSKPMVRFWESRFGHSETDPRAVKEAKALYVRWFHNRSMLLWLQRQMLARCFPHADPLAGRDDETPYDYDHICPRNDWSPDRRFYSSSFRGHCEDRRADILGDCIGNYQVLDSRVNRGHQDDPPVKKLGLNSMDSDETRQLLTDSLLDEEEEISLWRKADPGTNQGEWQEERARAFQTVVESRAFRLFEVYYNTAGFADWLSHDKIEGSKLVVPGPDLVPAPTP